MSSVPSRKSFLRILILEGGGCSTFPSQHPPPEYVRRVAASPSMRLGSIKSKRGLPKWNATRPSHQVPDCEGTVRPSPADTLAGTKPLQATREAAFRHAPGDEQPKYVRPGKTCA